MSPEARDFEASVVCILLFSIAVMLYKLKVKQRFIYGTLEITFALVAAWKWYVPLGKNFGDLLRYGSLNDLVAAAGIIYVIVRGIDNCTEYLKQKRKAST